MATWPTIARLTEQYGRRAMARTLKVSDGTIREALKAREDRRNPRIAQMRARHTLEQDSKGLGETRLRRLLEADRAATRGEKSHKSSVPRGSQSKNAPKSVKLPGVLKGATQVGKEGGHALYASQVETLVGDMAALIGPDRPWHVAVHGTYLDPSGRYSHGKPDQEVTGWQSTVLPGSLVLEAFRQTQREIADEKANVAGDMAKMGRPLKEIGAEKRRITGELAVRLANRLFPQLVWVHVDALYIRAAKEFGQPGSRNA